MMRRQTKEGVERLDCGYVLCVALLGSLRSHQMNNRLLCLSMVKTNTSTFRGSYRAIKSTERHRVLGGIWSRFRGQSFNFSINAMINDIITLTSTCFFLAQ
jgi:hypothetical protein